MKTWDTMTAGYLTGKSGDRRENGAWLTAEININQVLVVNNNKLVGIILSGDIPEVLVG